MSPQLYGQTQPFVTFWDTEPKPAVAQIWDIIIIHSAQVLKSAVKAVVSQLTGGAINTSCHIESLWAVIYSW